MSERFKYSLNGVYRCENFAQHLARDHFPRVPIDTAGWYIFLKTKVIKNKTFVYPVINNHHKPQLHIHAYFNILGNDGESLSKSTQDGFHLMEIYGPTGPKTDILDVLNEKNGYLDDGALVIEYGLHVMSVLGDDGIWKFNFDEQFFNSEHALKIEYGYSEDGSPKVLYGHKQLLCFHSPILQNQDTKFISNGAEKSIIQKFLQIAHGVRVPLNPNFLVYSSFACYNQLRNVVQYVDQQLVGITWRQKMKSSDYRMVETCIKLGLRHFFADFVNDFECLEDLKEYIQKLDIETLSGEVMKTFMAKIFELGI